MPSYAQDVKNELAHKFDADLDCLRAEFVALMKFGAKIIDGRFEFLNFNAAVARKVITLAKKIFPTVKPEVASIRRKKLLKNLRYVVRFVVTNEVQNFFDALDLDELLRRTRCKIAYLRGAFLARGTLNRPESSYFFEVVSNEAQAHFLCKLLNKLDFRAKVYRRKKEFGVRLKESDAICDFLGMVGADEAVDRFEIARNIKEIRMQVNRVVNMETSSLNHAVDVAQRQLADIRTLLANKVYIHARFKEAVELRLANPTCTVTELAEKTHLSRANLNYRFKIIRRMASKFDQK